MWVKSLSASIFMKNKYKGLFRFLLVYILIFLAAISIGNYIYGAVKKDIVEMTVKNKTLVLEQNAYLLNTQFSYLEQLTFDTVNSYAIMLLNDYSAAELRGNPATHLKALQKIQEGLLALNNGEHMILDQAVYYECSDYIISNIMIEKRDVYFSDYVTFPAEITTQIQDFLADDAKNLILPATTISYHGTQTPVVTFLTRLESTAGQQVISIIYLDVEFIFSYLSLTMEDDAYLSLARNAQPLLDLHKDSTLSSGFEIVSLDTLQAATESAQHISIKHSSYNLTLHFWEPSQYFYETTQNLDTLFFFVGAVYCLVGFACIITLIKRNLKEVFDIFTVLQVSTLNEAKENASLLMQNNQVLTAENQVQSSELQKNLLRQLISNAPQDAAVLDETLANARATFTRTGHYQIVTVLSEKGSMEEFGQIHNAMLQFQHPHRVEIAESLLFTSTKEVYLLRYYDTGYEARTLAEIETLNHRYPAITIGVGTICQDLRQLHRSYAESKCVTQVRQENRNTPIVYTAFEHENSTLYYPEELETKLINSACLGDYNQILQLLQHVNQENILNRQLMGHFIKSVKHHQIGTLAKITEKPIALTTQTKENIARLSEYMIDLLNKNEYIDIKMQIEDILQRCYFEICADMKKEKQVKDLQNKEQILQYINDHITDPALSTALVLEKFDISRTYLFNIVKERTNKNFSTYVEEHRLDIASNLLKESNLPVYAIAQKVGYSSTNTFCRAYKRKYGISPNQMREE